MGRQMCKSFSTNQYQTTSQQLEIEKLIATLSCTLRSTHLALYFSHTLLTGIKGLEI